jgi:hypothetical protein
MIYSFTGKACDLLADLSTFRGIEATQMEYDDEFLFHQA